MSKSNLVKTRNRFLANLAAKSPCNSVEDLPLAEGTKWNWESNRNSAVTRESSAEQWAHKWKMRPLHTGQACDEGESISAKVLSTKSNLQYRVEERSEVFAHLERWVQR